VAYAILAEGRSTDELEELDITLGMTPDPEEVAMQMLREHQAAMGMEISTEKPPRLDENKDEVFR
jgi:hypothetical protein